MNAPVPIAMGPVPSSESSTAIPESSINLQIEESKKRKREKSYSKCNQCRTDKQKVSFRHCYQMKETMRWEVTITEGMLLARY